MLNIITISDTSNGVYSLDKKGYVAYCKDNEETKGYGLNRREAIGDLMVKLSDKTNIVEILNEV